MEWFTQITTCYDLNSCFQAVYNLGLVFLFALAFLNMVYGAIEYLFSAGSITSKESGKKRIMNSIGAIVIVLVLPQVLHIINPKIFKVKLKIPTVERANPAIFKTYEVYWGEAETFTKVDPSISAWYYSVDPNKVPGRLKDYVCFSQEKIEADKDDSRLSYTSYNGIPVSGFVHEKLTNCLEEKIGNNFKIRITQGYNLASPDRCHQAGHCIDIVPDPPTDKNYNSLLEALVYCGFSVLNESEKTLLCGSQSLPYCPLECKVNRLVRKQGCPCYFTGPHLHAYLNIVPK